MDTMLALYIATAFFVAGCAYYLTGDAVRSLVAGAVWPATTVVIIMLHIPKSRRWIRRYLYGSTRGDDQEKGK